MIRLQFGWKHGTIIMLGAILYSFENYVKRLYRILRGNAMVQIVTDSSTLITVDEGKAMDIEVMIGGVLAVIFSVLGAVACVLKNVLKD